MDRDDAVKLTTMWDCREGEVSSGFDPAKLKELGYGKHDSDGQAQHGQAERVFEQERLQANKRLTEIVYLIYAIGFLLWFCCIIGLVINYAKRKDVAGTYLESHFRWQIRTFWFTVLWSVVGSFLLGVIVGWLILAILAIWYWYRLIRGWLNLNDGKPLYVEESES